MDKRLAIAKAAISTYVLRVLVDFYIGLILLGLGGVAIGDLTEMATMRAAVLFIVGGMLGLILTGFATFWKALTDDDN